MFRRATTRVLGLAMVLAGLAMPAQATVMGTDLGVFQPPDEGTDGYVCYGSPIDPPGPGAIERDESCQRGVVVVALPMKPPVPTPVPAPGDLTVRYRTVQLERPPVGYVPVRDAVLTVAGGSSSGWATVRLLPTTLREERFVLELYQPSRGAVLVNPRVVVTIKRG
jgi:hypothetical protein